MTGRVDGKVAFITGAARGQGRSHAITLAREGADIIAVDIEGQIDSVPYPMATPEDVAQTVKEVEATGGGSWLPRSTFATATRSRRLWTRAVARLCRLDIVSANGGVVSYGRSPIYRSSPGGT
jgi:(+)-trans-carveol dehydrogenase